MKKSLLLSVLTFLFISSYATIRNVPANYPTIQAAINACNNTDTVLVQPGTYYEHIIIGGGIPSRKIFSAGDSSNTIISANNSGRVMEIYTADSTTIIRGFKLTGSQLDTIFAYGGGIYISAGCDPRFEMVSICNNHLKALAGEAQGGGIYCMNGNPVFENCAIWGNQIDSAGLYAKGGGVYLEYNGSSGSTHSRFINCKIDENHIIGNDQSFGAGLFARANSVTLINVSISGNTSSDQNAAHYGTGLYLADGTDYLTNVLVASNIMGAGTGIFNRGGGLYTASYNSACSVYMTNVTFTDNRRSDGSMIHGAAYFYEDGTGAAIKNSILWNPNTGSEIEYVLGSMLTNVTYNDIRGGFTGTGNIDINPSFISTTDFHLLQGSPCINVGTLTGAPTYDLDNMPRPAPIGTNPDMGCYEKDQLVSVQTISEENNSLNLFPNPCNEELTIHFNIASKKERIFELYNSTGEKIKSMYSSESSLRIPVNDLQNGIYNVTVSTNGAVQNEKFVVNH